MEAARERGEQDVRCYLAPRHGFTTIRLSHYIAYTPRHSHELRRRAGRGSAQDPLGPEVVYNAAADHRGDEPP
jgi:hypothetical protein